jgi:hypothetical protein
MSARSTLCPPADGRGFQIGFWGWVPTPTRGIAFSMASLSYLLNLSSFHPADNVIATEQA